MGIAIVLFVWTVGGVFWAAGALVLLKIKQYQGDHRERMKELELRGQEQAADVERDRAERAERFARSRPDLLGLAFGDAPTEVIPPVVDGSRPVGAHRLDPALAEQLREDTEYVAERDAEQDAEWAVEDAVPVEAAVVEPAGGGEPAGVPDPAPDPVAAPVSDAAQDAVGRGWPTAEDVQEDVRVDGEQERLPTTL